MEDDAQNNEEPQDLPGDDEAPEEAAPPMYPSWAMSLQCPASKIGEAMQEKFDEGYPDADEGTVKQFEHAKSSILALLKDEGSDWYQLNASGSHPHDEDSRPHFSISFVPVATPYGTGV